LSNYAEFFQAVKAKLEQATEIIDVNNVYIGESYDLLGRPNSEFPRLEFQIRNIIGEGYYAQRLQDENVSISIQGFLRRGQDDLLQEDMDKLIDFSQEVRSLIFSFHNDKIQGIPVPKGFIQISGYTEMWSEFEIMPKTSTFIFNFAAKFGRHDTNP
jgi:hypothetical protein